MSRRTEPLAANPSHIIILVVICIAVVLLTISTALILKVYRFNDRLTSRSDYEPDVEMQMHGQASTALTDINREAVQMQAAIVVPSACRAKGVRSMAEMTHEQKEEKRQALRARMFT